MAILTVSLAALNLQVVEGATVVAWKRKINAKNSVVPGPMTYAFTNASGIATMELAANLPSECYEVRIIILGDLKFSALIQMPATDANIQDIIISGTGEEAGAGGGIVIVSGVSDLQNTGAGAGLFSGLSGTIAQLRSLVAGNGMQIDVVGTEIMISATGSAGADGLSAYQVAVANGYVGTEVDWLASLVGAQGPAGAQGIQGVAGQQGIQGVQGEAGLSAYQVAVNAGFVGSEAQWLASLVGPAGAQGAQGIQGVAGVDGANGAPGETGAAGLSAYQLAVQSGFVGTQSEWLASLQGIQGPQGPAGNNGQSAYEIAVAGGYAGTEAQWLDSLVGPAGAVGPAGTTGADGLSAYQVAVAGGYVGTESEWLDSLRGPQGIQGFTGDTGATGQSAYALAVSLGFVGTEQDWIASLKGVKGDIGDTGPAGATGPAGPAGPAGPQGIQGIQGKSAYQVAVDAGFVGTQAEWLTSLIGDSGLTAWDMTNEVVSCAYPLNMALADIQAAGFTGLPTMAVDDTLATYAIQSGRGTVGTYVARNIFLSSVPVDANVGVIEWALTSEALSGGAGATALKIRFGLIDKTTPANVVGVLEFDLKDDGSKTVTLITDLGSSTAVSLASMPSRVSMAFNAAAGTIAVRLDDVAQAFSANTYTATADATPEIRFTESSGVIAGLLGKTFSVRQHTAAHEITGTHAAGAKDICGHTINDAVLPSGPNSVLIVSQGGVYRGTGYATNDILVVNPDGVNVQTLVQSGVQSYPSLASFPVSGESDALYIAADTGLVYRWDGSAYAEIDNGVKSGGLTKTITVGNTADAEYSNMEAATLAMKKFTGQRLVITLTSDVSATSMTNYTFPTFAEVVLTPNSYRFPEGTYHKVVATQGSSGSPIKFNATSGQYIRFVDVGIPKIDAGIGNLYLRVSVNNGVKILIYGMHRSSFDVVLGNDVSLYAVGCTSELNDNCFLKNPAGDTRAIACSLWGVSAKTVRLERTQVTSTVWMNGAPSSDGTVYLCESSIATLNLDAMTVSLAHIVSGNSVGENFIGNVVGSTKYTNLIGLGVLPNVAYPGVTISVGGIDGAALPRNIAVLSDIETFVTPSYAEGSLPAASTMTGRKIFNSTYNVEMRSNGTRWIPLGPFTVEALAPDDTVTGTTALTLMRSVSFPWAYMGPKGELEVQTQWTFTNNANTKSPAVKLSTAADTNGGTIFGYSATGHSGQVQFMRLHAMNSETVQQTGGVSTSVGYQSAAAPAALNLTFTGLAYVNFMCQPSNSADTVVLKYLRVQVYPGGF